jgi:hypothetical protein
MALMHDSPQVLSSLMGFPMDGLKVRILEMGLVVWGTRTDKSIRTPILYCGYT